MSEETKTAKVKHPTFSKDGKRSIYCPICCGYVATSYLGQTYSAPFKCKKCRTEFGVAPARLIDKDGQLYVEFGLAGENGRGVAHTLYFGPPENK